MKFENEKHLFNSYARALKKRFSVVKQDERFLEEVCKAVYNNRETVRNYFTEYQLTDVISNLWRIAEKNNDKITLFDDLNKYRITLIRIVECINNKDESKVPHLLLELVKNGYAFQKGRIDTIKSNVVMLRENNQRRKCMSEEDLLEVLKPLRNVTGIYMLRDKQDEIIYIGKSISLGERIVGSLREKNAWSFQYSLVAEEDVHILELYLISKNKPILNTDCKTERTTNLHLPTPEFSELYRVFEEREEVMK